MDYSIGDLTLRPRRQLMRGDRPLSIGRKALELLSVLAEAKSVVVTKDELMAAVWPGVVVEENAIQVHVAALRRAMGADAIRLSTVRSLGYRLDALPCAAGPADDAVHTTPLIAVLAFEPRFSGAADLSHLAEGIAEEILNAVAKVQGVRVIARTSTFPLRGKARRPLALAAVLGVTHILDGSVRCQGDKIRIGVQLIAAADETILWVERFDGALADLFSLEEATAVAVAAALRLRIVTGASRVPVDVDAYDGHLQGRRPPGSPEKRQQC